MRKEELDILLEKYYVGQTTTEEEKTLSDFFLSGEVPEGYEQEKEIFRFMAEESMLSLPISDLNEKIFSALDKNRKQQPGLTVGRRIYLLSGVAAAIVIIVGSWFFLARSNESADTFDDPKLAYAAAMQVLYDVSSMINDGTGSLQPISKMNAGSLRTIVVLDKTVSSAGKSLRSLDYINRTIEMTNAPDNKNEPR